MPKRSQRRRTSSQSWAAPDSRAAGRTIVGDQTIESFDLRFAARRREIRRKVSGMRRARAAVAGADGAEQAPGAAAGNATHADPPDWLSAAGRPAFEELR